MPATPEVAPEVPVVPVPTPPVSAATPVPPVKPTGFVPPWADGEFDAERAAKLLENKDGDLKKAQARIAKFEADAAASALAQLSELEQAKKLAKDAQDALAGRELAALRDRVALTKGLTVAEADLLFGDTQEALETRADTILALKGTQARGVPSADGQGAVGTPIGGPVQLTEADVSKLYAEKNYDAIEEARTSGRLATVLGAKPTP